MSRFIKLSLFVVISAWLVSLGGGHFYSLAQDDLEQACRWERIKEKPQQLSTEEYKSLLKKCQTYYQQKSKEIEKDITKTEQKKKTLQNKIYTLNKKIENLSYQIYQSNLVIKDLRVQIEDTEESIQKASTEIRESIQELSAVLRAIYEEDQKSTAEILLSEEKLSSFFDNLVALEALNSKNRELLEDIKDLKSYLKSQKQSLNKEKEQLEDMVKIQTLQKNQSAGVKKEKQRYLSLTEQKYQQQLEEKEKTEQRAVEIRERLFELIGVSKAPTFGEAYKIAKQVSGITGVRPALLLAVLRQESDIGKNVGQCYLKNKKTGDGVVAYNGKEISKVMKPARDIQPFLKITKELGRNWDSTPISCPIPSVGGYGGAMGPAQFIPSTWMKYKDKVKEITGKPANPWKIKDSFLAAALYLADYGAAEQTYNAEWKAAMIYFSGSTNPRYSFYGDSVMSIAKDYAEDIRALEQAE